MPGNALFVTVCLSFCRCSLNSVPAQSSDGLLSPGQNLTPGRGQVPRSVSLILRCQHPQHWMWPLTSLETCNWPACLGLTWAFQARSLAQHWTAPQAQHWTAPASLLQNVRGISLSHQEEDAMTSQVPW